MNRPNLLFIFSDEQQPGTIGAYGNNSIRTPNLDRLAGDSTLFERAYCTQPVCTPSRGSILTGQWPATHGAITNNVPLAANAQTLPELLSPSYDAVGYVGKWHLGDEIFPQHAFQYWRSIEDAYIKWYSPNRKKGARSDYHHFLSSNGIDPDATGSDGEPIFTREATARLPENLSRPAFVADAAIQFLRENRDRSFALYVNFLEPHMPFFSCRDDQYAPSRMPLPTNFDAPRASRWQEILARAAYHHGESGLPLRTEEEWKRVIANYWGLSSLVDTHTGRLLDVLKELDLYDNTVIVYTSDHGDMMGSHRMIGKQSMFEESLRVPLMIRFPGSSWPPRVKSAVSQIDLVPTLLDLLGASSSATEKLPGQSLRRLIRADGNESTSSRNDVFAVWHAPEDSFVVRTLYGDGGPDAPINSYLADLGTPTELQTICEAERRAIIRDGRHKLVLSTDGEHMQFDLALDPEETVNRFSPGDRITDELTATLLEHLVDQKDVVAKDLRTHLIKTR